MQQYADIYLLQSHSTCFGCHSGITKTVTAASGTGHNIGTATGTATVTATSLQPWPVPEAAVTAFSSPVLEIIEKWREAAYSELNSLK